MEASSAVVRLLVDCTLKSLFIAVIAGLVLTILRCRDANVRHRVGTFVLVAMLVLPAIAWMLPAIESPLWLSMNGLESAGDAINSGLPGSEPPNLRPLDSQPTDSRPTVSRYEATEWNSPAEAAPVVQGWSPVPADSTGLAELPTTAEQTVWLPAASRSLSWCTICLVVYLGGVALLLARLAVGIVLTRRIVRRGRRLTSTNHAAFADNLTIIESSEVRTPATVGVWRPAILLPSGWATWSAESLWLVVEHESLHGERRDALVNLLANLNVALYWFNPLSWFLRRRLADLAERVCDDEVLRTHGDHAGYAETLLTVASRLAEGGRVSPLVVPMARRADVETRIEAIIDETRPLCRPLGWRGVALMLTLAVPVITGIAALQPAGTAPAAEADKQDVNREAERSGADRLGQPRALAAGQTTNPTHERGEEPTTKDTKDTKEEASRQRERPESATGQDSESTVPAGIVAGRVVSDTDGLAVKGAEVRLTGWNEGRTHYDQKTAVTDGEGQFRFNDLPGGALQVVALKENLASRTERYHGLKVKPGDNAIELRMKPVPALRVKVVDKETQKPLPGAMVRLTWTDGQRDHTVDDQGKVLVRGLTPELWTIEVFAEGYAEREEAIQLVGAETTTITAALEPGFVVEGVVVDEDQNPLEGVGISVFPRDFSGGQIEYLKTDAQGTYRFGYLPLAGLQFGFSKSGFADQRIEVAPQVEAGKVQRLDATLSPRRDGGFVEGTVVDSDGQPIVGAKITNIGRSSRDVRETFADADGRFRIDDAFKGIEGYVLVVKSPGFAPGIAAFEPGTRDAPTQVEVILKPGYRVRGRVVDEQGDPLPGIYVGFDGQVGFGNDGDGSYTITGPDGKFKLDSLPGYAKFDIRTYSTAGKFSAWHEHKLPLGGDEEVVVTLPAEGVIRGRVMDAATGKPLPTFVARVTFSPDRTNDDPGGMLFGPRATGDGETFISEQGEFRMGSFTQGMPLQVTIQADGYEREVMRRVVARRESDAEPVVFRLQPIEKGKLITFAGQVADQAGKGVGGVELRLIVAAERRAVPRDRFPFNWQMVRTGGLGKVADVKQFLNATSDRDGKFQFDGVMSGADMEIAYWGPGVSQGRLAGLEKIDNAKRQNLRIDTEPSGLVVGKIDQGQFPKVDNILLMGSGTSFYGKLNNNGASYEIHDVPAGNYELQLYRLHRKKGSAFRETEVLHRERVEVKSGETTEVLVGQRSQVSREAERVGDERAPATNPTRQRGEEPTTKDAKDTKEEASRQRERPEEKQAASEPAQPVPQKGDIIIRGKVTDEAGQPVADALLILPTKFGPEGWSAETTSTASGEFELKVPAAEAAAESFRPGMTIWCYHPERRLTTAYAYGHLLRETAESIVIVAGEQSYSDFVVTGPDGQPLAEALIKPSHFQVAPGNHDYIPEEIRNRMAVRTNSEGAARLPISEHDGLGSIEINAHGFGVQIADFWRLENMSGARTIKLRAAGRIEGQLVCEDQSLVAGVLIGFDQVELGDNTAQGQALVTSDSEGRFVVPEFAEGRTQVVILTKPEDPLLPRVPGKVDVFAGETTRLEIPYERAVHLAGQVRTEDGRVVPEALVSVQYGGWHQGVDVRTSAEGRFAANVLPGKVRQQLIMRPREFQGEWTEKVAGWETIIEVPNDVQDFELPPIELIPTVARTGQLLDSAGQPLPDMRILAVTGNRTYSQATSDEAGRFVLHLPEDLEVEEYKIFNDRGAQMVAEVVTDLPLVLRVGE